MSQQLGTGLEAVIAEASAARERAKARGYYEPLVDRSQRTEVARTMLREAPRELHLYARDTEHEEKCRAWQWGNAGMVLSGATGTGKSAAMVRLMRRILSAGVKGDAPTWDRARRVMWVSAFDLGASAKRSALGAIPEAVERARNASLLLLDELGREDVADATIAEVLDARYAGALPTIATTGLEIPALCARYSDASIRRIFESGWRQ